MVRQAFGARQELRHLLGGHDDLGRDEPGAQPLGLLGAETLGREADTLGSEHQRTSRQTAQCRGEAPCRDQIEEIHEQVGLAVRIRLAANPELDRAGDPLPRQVRPRGALARGRVPDLGVLVLPHATRVIEVRAREELQVGRSRKAAAGLGGDERGGLERPARALEPQQEGAQLAARLELHRELEHQPEHALAPGEIGKGQRLDAEGYEPVPARRRRNRLAVAALGDIEAPVGVKAYVLARRQQHVGRQHAVERATVAKGVQGPGSRDRP